MTRLINAAIKSEVDRRRISRLCHFTPSRNLIHIASGQVGVLPTAKLEEPERTLFTATDLQRFDKHKDYVCCSIEYPNTWYFAKAKDRDPLFKEWCILFIHPRYLWKGGTRFCQRNASAAQGRAVSEGADAFLSMFAAEVSGARDKTYSRQLKRELCCPTDEQAEVLVPGGIELADILSIAVVSESQAKSQILQFRLAGVPNDKFKFVIAPHLFDKTGLSKLIQEGKRPKEALYTI